MGNTLTHCTPRARGTEIGLVGPADSKGGCYFCPQVLTCRSRRTGYGLVLRTSASARRLNLALECSLLYPGLARTNHGATEVKRLYSANDNPNVKGGSMGTRWAQCTPNARGAQSGSHRASSRSPSASHGIGPVKTLTSKAARWETH